MAGDIEEFTEEDDTIQREKRKARAELKEKEEDTIQREKRKAKGNNSKEKTASKADIPKRRQCTEYWQLSVATVTVLILAGVATLHIFSWLDIGIELNLINVRREDTWDMYDVMDCLVMVDYILWTWVGVYALQLIWIIYSIVIIFVKTKKGVYLYMQTNLVPLSVNLFMILAYVATFGWILLWNRFDYMRYSVACEGGATLFSFIALVTSMLYCRAAEPHLVVIEQTGVLIRIGLFIQNGLAAFATMTAIMTNFQLSIILTLEANVSATVACYVSYGLLLTFIAVYFIIDTCLSDRHAQCVIMPYILIILVYVGAFFKMFNKEDRSDSENLIWILALVGGGSVAVMLLVKISVAIVRAQHRKSHDRKESLKRREKKGIDKV